VKDDLEGRKLRLAETIAWCGLQKLINKPIESEDVKRRRALGERAANHAFAAHQLEKASLFKWINRKKVRTMMDEATQMHREARLHEIRPLAQQLRTAALKPAIEFSITQKDDERAAIVEAICDARRSLSHESGRDANVAKIGLLGGKILRYMPRGRIADGSPGYESKGFLNWECAPPWDTWVRYSGGSVISYVPRVLCGLAQLGIEVDPADCLRWADTVFVTQTFGQVDP
jgi:hypothetical protein